MRPRRFSWKALPALLLAAFFLAGAVGNTFASEQIAADYRRWGYPDGFRYVTGLLELAAAALLVQPTRRLWGALLGAGIMAAAAATVLLHGEYTHAIAPLAILSVAATVAWLHRPGARHRGTPEATLAR